MRKTILLTLFTIFQLSLISQVLIESFEDWEPSLFFEVPANWETNQDSNFARFEKSTEAVEGDYSLKIIPGTTSATQGCISVAQKGISLNGSVGQDKLLTFFVKTIPENPNISESVFLRVSGSFYKQGSFVGNYSWNATEKIESFEEFSISFPNADIDSIAIVISGGAEEGSNDECETRSISWIDNFQIKDSEVAESCNVPCEIYCPRLDTCVNVCSTAGVVVSADNCADAEIATLCDLDGFTTLNCPATVDGPGALIGFCSNGSSATIVHNNVWIGFEPLKSGRLHLSIEINECFSPYLSCNGLQAAVARAECSNPGNVFTGFEYETLDCVNCIDQSFDLITVEAIAGIPHYIMIDGCCGDICDYTIHVIDGFEESSVGVSFDNGEYCSSLISPNCGHPKSNAIASATVDLNEDPNPEFYFTWTNPWGQTIFESPANLGDSQCIMTGVNPATGLSYFCMEGTYMVEAKNLNDCSRKSTEFEVVFQTTSQVQIELDGPQDLSCNEPMVQLIAAPIDNNIVPLQNEWYKIDDSTTPPTITEIINGNSASLSVSLEDPLTGPGTYLYNMYDANSFCPSEVLIEIFANNIVTSEIILETPGELDCILNPTVQLDAASTFLVGSSTILWTSEDDHPIENPNSLIPIVSNPGIYTITITNNENGCASSDEIEVFLVSSAVDYSIEPDPNSIEINCQNQNEIFTIMANIEGGVNAEVIWYDASGQIISMGTTYEGLLQDLASVTINNLDNTCSTSEMFSISENTIAPIVDFPGSITINCQNPTSDFPSHADFTVVWFDENNTAATDPITQSGVYQAVVTDPVNFCETTADLEVIIQEDPQLTLMATDVSCHGANDGTISLSTQFGLEPFTYEWETPTGMMTLDELNALTMGNYAVTITDANNCTTEQSITINEPEQLLVDISEIGNLLSANVQGGITPYIYLWNTGSTDSSLGFNPDEQYTVTVTDANGCVATSIRSGCSVFCLTSQQNVNLCSDCGNQVAADNCADAYIGTIAELDGFSTTVCGLTADSPFDNEMLGFCGPGTVAQNNMWIGFEVPEGMSSVLLEIEVIACQSTNTVCSGMQAAIMRTVCDNPGNVFNPNVFPGKGYEVLNCVNCANQTFTLSTNDLIPGVPHYLMVDGCCGDICEFKINVIEGLPMSNYELELVNEQLCRDILNPFCSAPSSTTTAILVSLDGSPLPENHEFTWYDPSGQILWQGLGVPTSDGLLSSLTGVNPTNGSPYFCEEGLYRIECRDQESCNKISTEFELFFTEIIETEISFLNGDQFDCNQQTLMLQGLPLNADIVFQNWWKVDFGEIPAKRDAIPISYGAQTNILSIELDNDDTGAGVYMYSHLDANNFCISESLVCIAADTITPKVQIAIPEILDCEQSTSITLDGSASMINRAIMNCNMDLNIQAGIYPQEEIIATSNYSLLWTADANQTITNETTFNPTISQPGIYSLTINNLDNGCSATASVEVLRTSTDLDFSIAPDPSGTTLNCQNQNDDFSFTIQTSNTNILEVEWLDLEGNIIATGQSYFGPVDNLAAVQVIDPVSGCFAFQDIGFMTNFVEPSVDFPASLQLGCSQMEIELPQNDNYNIIWMDQNGDVITGTINQVGTYIASIVDPINGCSIIYFLGVDLSESLKLSIDGTNPLCYQSSDGTLTTTIESGQAPFVYSWMTPNGNSSEPVLDNLTAGEYNLTVTDANDCTTTESFVLSEPTELTCSIIQELDALTSIGVGGTAPFSYQWSNGDNAQSLLFADQSFNYSVTITDANNCSCVANYFACNISVNFPLAVSLNCIDQEFILPDDANYNVIWSDENGNPLQGTSITVAGTYTAMVEDEVANCFIEHSLSVSKVLDPEIEISSSNISCFGAADGSINFQIYNGAEPFAYEWFSPNGTEVPMPNTAIAGTYMLTVTDANGCSDTGVVNIMEPETLDAQIFLNQNNNLEVQPSGGTAPYTFLWSTGHTGSILVDPMQNVSYSITVTDANSCVASSNFAITGACELYCALTDTFTNLCSDCGTVVAVDDCIDANPISICELDGFQTNTCGFTPDGLNDLAGFCAPGSSIENNLWIAFKPTSSGRLHLNIEVTNCLSPNPTCNGLQGALLRGECTNSNAEPFETLDCVNCIDQTFDLITVDAIASVTHFIMFDACCGDACELVVNIIDAGELASGWSTESINGIMCPSILDPSCNTIVSPASITINNFDPNINNEELTFNWYDSDGSLVQSESLIVGVNDPLQSTLDVICAPGTYEVEILNNSNCCATTETIEYVLQEPNLASIEATNINFGCDISEIILTGSFDDITTIPSSQIWSKVDSSTTPPSLVSIPDSYGSQTTNLNIVKDDPNTGVGTYLFQIMNANSSCFSEALITIDDGENGVAPEIIIATPEILTCDNFDGIQLDASASVLNGNNVTILWTTNNGSVIQNANSLKPTVFAVGEYILTFTNEDTSCSSTASVIVINNENEINYEIMPDPSEEIVLNCFNPVIFGLQVIHDASKNYEVTWFDQNGMVISTGSVFSGGSNLPASVSIQDLETNCTVSENFTIVSDFDPPTVDFPSISTIDCQPINLPTDSIYVVEWFTPDGALIVDNIVTEPGDYYATILDESNGCTSTELISVVMSPALIPDSNIIPPTCFGYEDGSIEIIELGELGPYSYSWSELYSDSTNASLTMISSGFYEVTVTYPDSCFTVLAFDIASVEMIVIVVETNNNNNLETVVSAGMEPYTYLWSTGDTTSILEDPLADQLYQVTVTDGNGCTSIGEGQLITSSENLIDLGSDISVYPNPTSEIVYIDYKEHHIRSTELSIYTALGQKINSLEKVGQLESLSLKGLPVGIYFLEIKTDIGRVVKRVIKH